MYKAWILKWHELPRKLQIFCVNIGCRCCSVAKLHPILCNPMDCSTPSFAVLHYVLEFAQNQAHWVNDAIQPSHPLSSPSLPSLNLSQPQNLFQYRVASEKKLRLYRYIDGSGHESWDGLFPWDDLVLSETGKPLKGFKDYLLPDQVFWPVGDPWTLISVYSILSTALLPLWLSL